MNATFMPNEFVGKIDECNKLIAEVNRTLGKPDESGVICPVVFIDNYDVLQNQLSETIGQLTVYSKGLKNKERYTDAIEKLDAVRKELVEKKNESNKRQIANAVKLVWLSSKYKLLILWYEIAKNSKTEEKSSYKES